MEYYLANHLEMELFLGRKVELEDIPLYDYHDGEDDDDIACIDDFFVDDPCLFPFAIMDYDFPDLFQKLIVTLSGDAKVAQPNREGVYILAKYLVNEMPYWIHKGNPAKCLEVNCLTVNCQL